MGLAVGLLCDSAVENVEALQPQRRIRTQRGTTATER